MLCNSPIANECKHLPRLPTQTENKREHCQKWCMLFFGIITRNTALLFAHEMSNTHTFGKQPGWDTRPQWDRAWFLINIPMYSINITLNDTKSRGFCHSKQFSHVVHPNTYSVNNVGAGAHELSCNITKLRAVCDMLGEFWAHIVLFLACIGGTESLNKHKIHQIHHSDCGL